MIPVKQAITAATNYLGEFSNMLPSLSAVRLEETDTDDVHGLWLITISFVDNPLTGHRLYKLFQVDGITGEVKAMKNRNMLTDRG